MKRLMKQFTIFACVMVIGAGTALAASLSVPFFRDTGSLINASGGTNSGFAGVIGISNTTGSAKEISITYTVRNLSSGLFETVGPFTFSIGASQGISWRPATTDPAEGVGSTVPNIPSGFNNGGSAVISWSGASTDIVGRYQEVGTSSQGFYLLPPSI